MPHGQVYRHQGTWIPFLGHTLPSSDVGPTAAFTLTLAADGATVTVNASGSKAGTNPIASYTFTFGDGNSASGTPATNVYAQQKTDVTYTVVLTVTDSKGIVDTTSRTVTVAGSGVGGGGGTYTPPWQLGTYDEGLPSSVVVVDYSDLYNLLTPSQQAAPNSLILACNQLQSYLASKNWGSYAVIQLPAGFDFELPGFTVGSDTYAHGISANGLNGFLGGLTNGVLQARISLKPNSMTAGQLATVAGLGTGSTNPFACVYQSGSTSGQAGYLMGMQFDGADMQTVTDYRETGPACYSGWTLYRPGPGSIIQNVLTRGFGHADSSSPPGEVGMGGLTRDQNSIVRRVEMDGRLPGTTTRRGGMIEWSGSVNPVVTDCWFHDSYVSGPTFSYASTISTANASYNMVTTNVRTQNNANHFGQKSGYRFAAYNHEEPQGYVVHNSPVVQLDPSVATLWDAAHMTYSNQGMPAGNVAATFTVHDPVILDGGAYTGDNGCFSVMTNPWSKSIGLSQPVVTRNGVALSCWVRTGAGTAPSYVTPDTYFIWKHQG